MTERDIPITGMTCASCEDTVAKVFTALPGIDSASASARTGIVRLTGASLRYRCGPHLRTVCDAVPAGHQAMARARAHHLARHRAGRSRRGGALLRDLGVGSGVSRGWAGRRAQCRHRARGARPGGRRLAIDVHGARGRPSPIAFGLRQGVLQSQGRCRRPAGVVQRWAHRRLWRTRRARGRGWPGLRSSWSPPSLSR